MSQIINAVKASLPILLGGLSCRLATDYSLDSWMRLVGWLLILPAVIVQARLTERDR